jgi:hypothetical protein
MGADYTEMRRDCAWYAPLPACIISFF